jgi:hypothetical protein
MQSIDILRCSMANEPETIVKLQRLQVRQRPIIYWDRSHSRTAFFKKRSEVPWVNLPSNKPRNEWRFWESRVAVRYLTTDIREEP